MDKEVSLYTKLFNKTFKDANIPFKKLLIEKDKSLDPIMHCIYGMNDREYNGYSKKERLPEKIKIKLTKDPLLIGSRLIRKSFLINKSHDVSMASTVENIDEKVTKTKSFSTKKSSIPPIKHINKKENTCFLTEINTSSVPEIKYIRVPIINRPKAKSLSHNLDNGHYDVKRSSNHKEIRASIEKQLLNTSEYSKELQDTLLTNYNNEITLKELKKHNEISKLSNLLDTRKTYYYSKDRRIDVEKEKKQVEYMMKNFDKVVKMDDKEAVLFKDIINKKFNYFAQKKEENEEGFFHLKFKRIEKILDKSRKKSMMIFEKLNKKKNMESFSSSANLGPLFD